MQLRQTNPPEEFNLSFLDLIEDLIFDFSKFGPDSHFYMINPAAPGLLLEALIILTLAKFNQKDPDEYGQLEKKFIEYLNGFGINEYESLNFMGEYIGRIAARIISAFGLMIKDVDHFEILGQYELKNYYNGSAFFKKRLVFSFNQAIGRD